MESRSRIHIRRTLFCFAAATVLAAGCTVNEGTHHVAGSECQGQSCRRTDAPTVNPPRSFRERNWKGNHPDQNKRGSCVYATLITLLRWQGRPHTAEYVRTHFADGAGPNDLRRVGIRYAQTFRQYDVNFLEWCIATRRGCGVSCSAIVNGKREYCRHCIALVHLDERVAVTIDPNFPQTFVVWNRNDFLTDWRLSQSWAFTPVYSPLAPEPIW